MKPFKTILIVAMLQTLFSVSTSAQQKQFKALLVTTTRGWHHESIHAGVLALQDLGRKNFFDVVLWEDPNGFTDKYLEQFQVVIFLCTTGDIFDSVQQKVMERFIEQVKGLSAFIVLRIPNMTGTGTRNSLAGCFIFTRLFKLRGWM